MIFFSSLLRQSLVHKSLDGSLLKFSGMIKEKEEHLILSSGTFAGGKLSWRSSKRTLELDVVTAVS